MRAFIAVPVSSEVKKRIEAFRKELAVPGCKTVEPENMHVTLFFLGEIGEERAERVRAALDSLTQKKFELKFSGAGVFPNPNFIRVAWVGCESPELKALYEELAPIIQNLGYKPEGFKAHLTVARVKDPSAKEEVRKAVLKFRKQEFGSCPISRIILFKSTLTPKGPHYEEAHSKELA